MSWLKNTPEALASIPMDAELSARNAYQRSVDHLVLVTGPAFRDGGNERWFTAHVAAFGDRREWLVPALSGSGWVVVYYLPIPPVPEA